MDMTTKPTTIDSRKCQTLDDFYATVAKVLAFPPHFGKNLDALSDCLCDLKSDSKIEITDFDFFLLEESDTTRNKVLDVLQDAASRNGLNVVVS